MEKNISKTLILAIILAFFCLTLVACASENRLLSLEDGYGEEEYSSLTAIPKKSDIALPKELADNVSARYKFGLQIFNGSKFVDAFENASFFNPNKPTIFYAHGMGCNGTFNNPVDYRNAGYNCFSFFWGAYADEEYLKFSTLAEKVWARDYTKRFLTDENKWVTPETDSGYSLTEIYAAYVIDFLSNNGGAQNSNLIFCGHSYGGMLSVALTSYLLEAYKSGLIGAEYLPDELTLFDPFFLPGQSGYHTRWLNDKVNDSENSAGYLTTVTSILKESRRAGVAVSLIRTSDFIAMPAEMPDKENYKELLASTVYVHGYGVALFSSSPDSLSDGHNYGAMWPVYRKTTFYDENAEGELAFNFTNPYEILFARNGTRYEIDFKKTPFDYEDDAMASSNITSAKIAGFVYFDKNGNGKLDEKISSHIRDVKVTLSGNGTEKEFVTSLNGYFEFDVTPGEYTVKIALNGDLLVAEDSAIITVSNEKQLSIHNFGVKKQ